MRILLFFLIKFTFKILSLYKEVYFTTMKKNMYCLLLSCFRKIFETEKLEDDKLTMI